MRLQYGLISLALLGGCATAKPLAEASSQDDSARKPPVAAAEEKKKATPEEAAAADGATDSASAAAQAALQKGVVYFAFDSADLLPESRAQLSKVAEIAMKQASGKVQIDGHTDERGTEEYNLVLAQSRAAAVEKYLERLGVPSKRLATRSYGEAHPANPGHHEQAWAQNRRAEILPEGAH